MYTSPSCELCSKHCTEYRFFCFPFSCFPFVLRVGFQHLFIVSGSLRFFVQRVGERQTVHCKVPIPRGREKVAVWVCALGTNGKRRETGRAAASRVVAVRAIYYVYVAWPYRGFLLVLLIFLASSTYIQQAEVELYQYEYGFVKIDLFLIDD